MNIFARPPYHSVEKIVGKQEKPEDQLGSYRNPRGECVGRCGGSKKWPDLGVSEGRVSRTQRWMEGMVGTARKQSEWHLGISPEPDASI